MSLIGLLTATEKQVHLGRLRMRPIQWHLKNNWRVPESLEKVIPIPGPCKTCSANIYRRIKEGWGAHLNEYTARGFWSLPESKLHINYLELKAVFQALKDFQALWYPCRVATAIFTKFLSRPKWRPF